MDELRQLGRGRQFLRGIRYAFAGMRLVATHPRLWPYVLAPALITVSLFVGVVLVAWPGFGMLLDALWTPAEHGLGVKVLWYGFWWFVRFLVVAIAAFVLYFTSGLFATPFNDRLSEEVETLVLGPYTEPFSLRQLLGDLANSLLHSTLSLALWLTILLASTALNLVPVFGSVASVAIGWFATAVFLARESVDGTLSRRRMTFRHKLRVVWAQLPMMLGLGTVAALLLWIPLMNFLILPMMIAGATLMYCHLEQAGLVPDAAGATGYKSPRLRNALLADHDLGDEELDQEIRVVAERERAEAVRVEVPPEAARELAPPEAG
jgi:CysZ protein